MLVYANVLQPLIDAADWLLRRLHDGGFSWGVSIILMTVIVRLAILPLTIKQIKSMNALRALQPQIKELQERYKGDRQAMNQAMMRFYQENKVNPFASCLPLLLQLPIFMSLFYLLRSTGFKDEAAGQGFLIIDDLTAKAVGGTLVVLMILFIGSQLGSTLVMSVTADKTQQRIMLMLPLFFAALIPRFPAGLILYWITTNFWTFGQQIAVRKLAPPPPVVTSARAGPSGGKGKRAAKDGDGKDGDGKDKVPVAAGAGPARKPPPPPRKRKRRRR
jgi:YidC/Oxa1 family membrane protein insertase